MALIACPMCGGQVSDKAKKCVHCGCDLTVPQKNDMETVGVQNAEIDIVERTHGNEGDVSPTKEVPDKKKSKKAVAIILAAVVIIAVVAAAAFELTTSGISNQRAYWKAVNLIEDCADYDDALAAEEIFESLGDYKDSAELLDESQYWYARLIVETDPEYTMSFFENEGSGYDDAGDRIADAKYYYCIVNEAEETYYNYAIINEYLLELIEDGYTGAEELYDSMFPKTFVFVNYEETDYTSIDTWLVSDDDDELYIHIIYIGEDYPYVEFQLYRTDTDELISYLAITFDEESVINTYIENLSFGSYLYYSDHSEIEIVLIDSAGNEENYGSFTVVYDEE